MVSHYTIKMVSRCTLYGNNADGARIWLEMRLVLLAFVKPPNIYPVLCRRKIVSYYFVSSKSNEGSQSAVSKTAREASKRSFRTKGCLQTPIETTINIGSNLKLLKFSKRSSLF